MKYQREGARSRQSWEISPPSRLSSRRCGRWRRRSRMWPRSATIVNGVVTNNPFGCTSYQSGGETLPAVEKTREAYTARIIYEDNEAAPSARPRPSARRSRPTTERRDASGRDGARIGHGRHRRARRPTATRSRQRSSATTRTASSTTSRSRALRSRSPATRPTRSSRPSRPGPTRCRRWPEPAHPLTSSGFDQCRRDGSGPPVHRTDFCPGALWPRPSFFVIPVPVPTP